MYKNLTVFCPRCGSRSLEMLTTHSYCTECNYSPDTDDHVHLHARDPVSEESIYEMDERARCSDDLDEENDSDDDEEEEEEDAHEIAARKRNEEIRKLKGFVRDGFLDPADLEADYPDHFGSEWYWDEDGIRTHNDPDYVDPDETWELDNGFYDCSEDDDEDCEEDEINCEFSNTDLDDFSNEKEFERAA